MEQVANGVNVRMGVPVSASRGRQLRSRWGLMGAIVLRGGAPYGLDPNNNRHR